MRASVGVSGRRCGVTIVELLIALAVFLLILGPALAMFGSSLNAFGSVERTAELNQNREAAVQILAYEIGMAGYRGVESDYDRLFLDATGSTPELQPTLEIVRESTGSFRILTRYFEDERFLALDGSDDGFRVQEFFVSAGGQLMRRDVRVQGDAGVGIVDGVTRLVVERYLSRTSVPVSYMGPEVDEDGNATGNQVPSLPPSDVAAIELTVEFDGGETSSVTVGLSSPQIVRAQ